MGQSLLQEHQGTLDGVTTVRGLILLYSFNMFVAGWHEFQFKPHSLSVASAAPRTCKCRQTHCSLKTEDVGQNEKKKK